MSTSKRLSEVFESAKVIPFNDSDKFVFFSDCHRGDNSWADDFAPNQNIFFYALDYYHKNGFTYIEIGDGDELWENSSFEEIKQAHSHIFWLLRKFHNEKRFYLIWGNHNRKWKNSKDVKANLEKYYNERTKSYEPLFENIETHEGLVLKHSVSGWKIFLVHGHQGDLMSDYLWMVGWYFVKRFWKRLQLLGFRDPTSPAKNFKKREKVEKEIMEWVKAKNQVVIAGHTHRSVFPEEGEPPYFNDGSCVHPRCITGIEIQNNEIALIKWSINTKDDGTLHVVREILGSGPKNLKSFFI